MSVNTALRRRKLGLKGRFEIDFAIDRIRLKEVLKLPNSLFDELDPPQHYRSDGPIASTRLDNDTIAISNEDGTVHLIGVHKLVSKTHWLAHDNAIFDIKTGVDNKTLITASGDNTIRVWDVEKKKELLNFAPHFSSIKSISIYDKNILASGSRDGYIKIHDQRVKSQTVIVIGDAHRNTAIRKPSSKFATKTDPISCVTNVVFDTLSPRLYSSGANDATLKLWDLRKAAKRRDREGRSIIHEPYQEVHHPVKGRHCGYSHLILSSGRVYASCSDNKIYCYEKFDQSCDPKRFLGYEYDPHIKMSIMDDRFLISGAKNGKGALVWSLGSTATSSLYYPEKTKQPLGQLRPESNTEHDTNVIETDWNSLSVFSIRDDGLVCKWSMQHVRESERKKLICENYLASPSDDITIQMADIIDVSVLRPNQRLSNLSQDQVLTI